jgi:hypothetical protein
VRLSWPGLSGPDPAVTPSFAIACPSPIPRSLAPDNCRYESPTFGPYSVSCWQKFRMLWRRGTGPKRHGRACPGYPRVSAQRATARGGEGKKALFLRPSRPRAALPGLVSEAARRGMAGTSPARTGEAPRRVGSSRPTASASRADIFLAKTETFARMFGNEDFAKIRSRRTHIHNRCANSQARRFFLFLWPVTIDKAQFEKINASKR